MRGFVRRISIGLLCLCLLCMPVITALAAAADNCPGSCTHQAAIGTTHYDTFTEALTAATDGCTVTLLADISDVSALVIDKAITLDLGGKTVTAKSDAAESLFLVTKDLTLKNGTLTANTQPCLSLRNCSLTVDEKVKMVCLDSNAIEMYGSGKLTIHGGEFQAKNHVIVMNIPKDGIMDAAITGGIFTCEKDTILIQKETGATAPEKFVTGGTYNQDPSLYVPDSCDIHDNGDGTYTVYSAYQLTFQSGGAYGTMAAVTVPCKESYTLPQCGFTPAENMEFAGWEIGGNIYAAGAAFAPKGNTIITAQWKTHEHYGGHATCLSPAICTGCGSTYGQYGSHDLSYCAGYGASCDSTGMTAHSVCNTCGICFIDGSEASSLSLSTPALGHQWKTEKGKEPTCTEDGSKEHRVCSVCGAIQIGGKDAKQEDLTLPALGHTMETIDATQATCTQPGVEAHTHCTTCDQLFRQNKPVALDEITSALSSHVLGDAWLSDETIHWKNCVDCSEVFRQGSHKDTDADGLCDDCGFAMAQEAPAPAEEDSGFSFLYLIPMAAAVAIAVPLAIKTAKKRK